MHACTSSQMYKSTEKLYCIQVRKFLCAIKVQMNLLLTFSLVSCYFLYCYGGTTINVVPGVHSTKAESKGLYLSRTYNKFKPIGALTVRFHVTSASAIFAHYQMTLPSNGYEFWSKLQIKSNDDNDELSNAGSLVHSGNQYYKTATGFYMDNLDPGYYTMEVHYNSPVSISVPSNLDYQTAILQVMWFEGADAISDGIKCSTPNPSYSTSYQLNAYGILSPLKDLEVTVKFSGNRVVLAAYQMSFNSTRTGYIATKMHMNQQQLKSTTMITGNALYLDAHGLWMKSLSQGEYYFGMTYHCSYHRTYFQDCQSNYRGNKNLYVMTLPSRCLVATNVRPTASLYFSSTSWRNTDLSITLTLSRSTNHVIVRYQFSGTGRNTYTITRLVIDSTVQNHTASIRGNISYAGNFGMWQGSLLRGTHTFVVQHRSGTTYRHYVYGSSYSWRYTRAMDIVYC